MGAGTPEVSAAMSKPTPEQVHQCLWPWLCLCCSTYSCDGLVAQEKVLEKVHFKASVGKSMLQQVHLEASVAVHEFMLKCYLLTSPFLYHPI